MNCQKCVKPAVVHLTELVKAPGGARHAVEIHLCLEHAVAAGFVAPGFEPVEPPASVPKAGGQQAGPPMNLPAVVPPTPMAIVPTSKPPAETMSIARRHVPGGGGAVCPVCGNTWSNFKATGIMGCPHDYEAFASRLAPLIKRAHEGAAQHVGKFPRHVQESETVRSLTAARLRREMAQAVEAENYEQAAKLRDQLKGYEE